MLSSFPSKLSPVAAAVALVAGPFLHPSAPNVIAADPMEIGEPCGTSEARILGYSDALNKTSFGGFPVAELSGLAYDSSRGVYYAVADRASAVQSHFFTLDVPISAEGMGTPSVQAATVLASASGTPYNGFTFDGEGIVISRHDELIVSSESGSAVGQQPEIEKFSLDGTHLASLPVASRFLIGANNLSFESLALSPNNHGLFTATEAPIGTDGRTSDLRSRIRIVQYENRGPEGFVPLVEYFYLTEPGRTTGDLGVAELIALSETDLLVLERGFVAGLGNTIRIFHVSLPHSPVVTDVASLSTLDAATHSQALAAKTLLVDLFTCPGASAAAVGNPPEGNFEGMTLGPRLDGGWRSLVLVVDDNNSATQTTRIVALAVPEPLLAGRDTFNVP